MKTFAAVTASAIALAGAAFAQTTTQEAVLGASDDAVYSLQVQGANGVIYNCKPDPVMVDGQAARACIQAGGAGVLDQGLAGNAAAGIGALALVALAAGGSSSTTTTTTTN